MQHAGYVPLHLHTEYSLLDGAIKIDELVKKAADFRLPALAITDHGNLFGAVEFYREGDEGGDQAHHRLRDSTWRRRAGSTGQSLRSAQPARGDGTAPDRPRAKQLQGLPEL
ncbi:MAG: PHP domain-containing protein [Desulfomicrobium escambiense]|nr:PHP domain-containing protein [Desulfomicrobium escambiense]